MGCVAGNPRPASLKELYNQLITKHGRSKETHIEKKKARPQYSQDRSGNRNPEVPALPEHEASAPCV
jgi:hypothetical protein